MTLKIFGWLHKKYPQNYIIKKPHIGTLIFVACCFGFITIYEPLNVHQSLFNSLEATMAVYCCALAIPVYMIVRGLGRVKYFSDDGRWTILKEIISAAIILLGTGISVYFIGFLLEEPAQRWNLATFADSCKNAVLIGIIPLALFTLMNSRYLFFEATIQYDQTSIDSSSREIKEELVQIVSQLKKEKLSFYPSQFVYAESDGNYVVFHLNIDDQAREKMIRNSISNIQQQLSSIPFLMRTHRAFIVNLKKVRAKKGNALGYRLRLHGTDAEIPISRQKTKDFDQLLNQYH